MMTAPRTVFARLPAEKQDRLRGSRKRLKLARLLLEELPEVGRGDGMTVLEMTYATGYDRVDVGNALRLLRDLELVERSGGRQAGQWSLVPPRPYRR